MARADFNWETNQSTWTALAFRGVLLPRHAFSPLKSPLIFYPPAYPYFIAAVYAPHSKYKVFWSLILAAPDDERRS